MSLTPEPKMLGVQWPDDLSATPVQVGNIFGFQASPDGVVLTIGQGLAALTNGTPEEQQEALSSMTTVTAQPLVRILMTPQRLQELLYGCVQTLEALKAQGLVIEGQPFLATQAPGSRVSSEQ